MTASARRSQTPSVAISYFRRGVRRRGWGRPVAEDVPVILESEVARGGEGAVFHVKYQPAYVAKILLLTDPARLAAKAARIEAMVAHPPRALTYHTRSWRFRRLGYIQIAWPNASIFQRTKRGDVRVGFLMAYIDRKNSAPLFKIYNVLDRHKTYPFFDWQTLLRVAANLAEIVADLHDGGYVIGDLNESNILVDTQAHVTVIDTDSMQVPMPHSDGVFRCDVGKAEYLPPELQGKDLRLVERRTPDQDDFGLAVLTFMLLMGGAHPFTGVWNDPSDPPPIGTRIMNGWWLYGPGSPFHPAPIDVPYSMLPRRIRRLFQRAFTKGLYQARRRPTARQWQRVLRAAQSPRNLVICAQNPRHQYPRHRVLLLPVPTPCPWCMRERRGLVDFPAASPPPTADPVARVFPLQVALLALLAVGGVVYWRHQTLAVELAYLTLIVLVYLFVRLRR